MCERVRVLAHTIASLLVIPSAEKIALDLEARGDVTTSPHDAEEDNDNPTSSSSSSSTASLLRLSRGMRGLIDTSAAFSRRRFADVTDERRRPTSVVLREKPPPPPSFPFFLRESPLDPERAGPFLRIYSLHSWSWKGEMILTPWMDVADWNLIIGGGGGGKERDVTRCWSN